MYSYIFYSKLCLLAFLMFLIYWVSFSFISKYFLVSLIISSLIHQLFRSMWFDFHIRESLKFPSINCLSLLVKIHFTIFTERILYNFSPFTFIDVCFMTYGTAYAAECFMFTWEDCVSQLGGMFYRCFLGLACL